MCLWILESAKDLGPSVISIEADSAPVKIAAASGWEDVVGLLIKLRFDPNLKAGRHGSTPLVLAITYGSPLVVKRLLELKVNVACVEADGQTPLIEAATRDYMETHYLIGQALTLMHVAGTDPRHYIARYIREMRF